MIDEQLHEWLLKNGSRRVSYNALAKVFDEILQAIAASLKTQRDEMAALKQTNQALLERMHASETRLLEVEVRAVTYANHD